MSTENTREQEKVRSEVDSVLKGAGIRLLEFSLSRHRGSLQVRAVVYSPSGTGTAECAKAHRLMLPCIQLAMGDQEPHMEISSPGIDRTFKSSREWEIFTGKRVCLLLRDEAEWKSGRIERVEQGNVLLAGDSGSFEVTISAVLKARLDSSREGV